MTEALRTLRRVRPARGAAPGDRGAGRRRDPRRRAAPGPVPARAVRRPAAARDDRLRAAHRAAAAARRRADDRARRDDPGRGHGDPRRPAPRARHGPAVHHPRPRARGRGLRPHVGHVRRADRRDPRERAPARPPAASVHRVAGQRAADDRGDGAPPDGDPGAPGERVRGPGRLRVRAALRLRPGRVPRDAPAGRGARRRPRPLHPRRRAARPSCRRWRAMPEAVLEATGLRKEFGDVVAVDGVDLHVAPGGSLAIVGESGLGQDDRRAHARRPDRADRGDDHRVRQATVRPRRGRRRSAAGAAARSRSSSRTPTRASTRATAPSRRSTRSCACTDPARRRSSARPAPPSSATWSASTAASSARGPPP